MTERCASPCERLRPDLWCGWSWPSMRPSPAPRSSRTASRSRSVASRQIRPRLSRRSPAAGSKRWEEDPTSALKNCSPGIDRADYSRYGAGAVRDELSDLIAYLHNPTPLAPAAESPLTDERRGASGGVLGCAADRRVLGCAAAQAVYLIDEPEQRLHPALAAPRRAVAEQRHAPMGRPSHHRHPRDRVYRHPRRPRGL